MEVEYIYVCCYKNENILKIVKIEYLNYNWMFEKVFKFYRCIIMYMKLIIYYYLLIILFVLYIGFWFRFSIYKRYKIIMK